MFRLFECCALSFFERFVLSFSLKIERFVSDSAEIWICGLYTLQQSRYDEPEKWSETAPAEKKIFRTPNTYGYFTATYTPIKPLSLSLSGTYTGSMLVQHMASYIDKDVAVNTRDFFDMGVKVAYDFKLYKSVDLQLSAGVQNVFNAYQNDFDQGVERDSGYIYGPAAPRSYFAGIKISY